MKFKLNCFLIFLIILACHIPLQGQGFVMKKDILVEKGEVQDNLLTFGGHIIVKGRVKQNVIAFGGTIVIEGEVGELVLGFGTLVTLKSTASIQGDVISLGGTLDKEPGTYIKGDTIFFNLDTAEDAKKFFREGIGGIFGLSLIPFFLIIKLMTLFIWFFLALVLTAIFPQQISSASQTIRKSFWPTFGLGFLALIVFAGMVIFAALLSIILIGIPILLALIFLGIAVKVFGQVILFHFFGDSLYRTISNKRKIPAPLPAVLIGFLFVGIIGFIPIIGSLFSLILSIIGWGIVIKTKFGSKSFPSKDSPQSPAAVQ